MTPNNKESIADQGLLMVMIVSIGLWALIIFAVWSVL
jgi:hypothetical protein